MGEASRKLNRSLRNTERNTGAPYWFKYGVRPDGLYEALCGITYHNKRYNRYAVVKKGQVRDGATGAIDVVSLAWWVHDQLCADGTWANGEAVTRWQAATVLHDILAAEGRWFRARSWWIATWLLGCNKVRKNKHQYYKG